MLMDASYAGSRDRSGDVDVGGEMEDGLRFLGSKDIPSSSERMSTSIECGVRGEVLPLAGGQVVHDGDLVPGSEQAVAEMRADEAGAACHQNLHLSLLDLNNLSA